MHEHDSTDHFLTDDELASVVGGSGDPGSGEPDSKATPILL